MAATVPRRVLDGCPVVTMDPARTEHAVGHVVVAESLAAQGVTAGERLRARRPDRSGYLPATS